MSFQPILILQSLIKLIYANKVLRTPGLTKDQKHGIVERFDDAGTINEVKIIFKSLTEGVKIGAAVKKSPVKKSVIPSVSKGNNNSINDFKIKYYVRRGVSHARTAG